ncbi:MAG: carboxylesterase family protein [Verrucomicrobiaceae bacterium]
MRLSYIAWANLVCGIAFAADAPKPAFTNVAYGPHKVQKLDFYQAKSDQPTPVVFFIHGGGWLNGDKATFNNAGQYLPHGITVVSINYRLIPLAKLKEPK